MASKNFSSTEPDSAASMQDLGRTLDDLDRLLAGEVLPPERAPRTDDDNRNLALLTRFVVGALVLGAEELMERARKWDDQAPKDPGPLAGGRPLEGATYGDLARYMVIGMVTSGRRSAVRFVRSALSTPTGLATSLLRTTDRLTGSLLLRPLQRPLSDAIQRADHVSRDWIDEGWQEEQISRWIAANGIPEIIDDVIHILSTNPELAELVRSQLSQQSISMASSVADTSRRLSAAGDELAENLVRRILRRGTRVEIDRIVPVEELPPFLIRTKGEKPE